ncbi:MAG TPA: DUF6263 family protein [Prolixibacteraceae bacterium]
MKSRLVPLFLISILLVANSIEAKSKALLRLNLQKGSVYEMTLVSTSNIDQEMMGQKMKIDQKMEMVYAYQVLDVLANKNFQIEYSIVSTKLNTTMNGQEKNHDSGSSDQSDPMNSILKDICSTKLMLEINPRGQVEHVEGLDAYAKKLAGNPQLAQSMSMFTDEVSFSSFVGQTFNYFPEKEIKKGDKWTSFFKLPSMMNMETTLNFEVASMDKHETVLNVLSDVNLDSPVEQAGMKMNMKMTGTQTGTMTIDNRDGWFRSSELNQKFNLNLKMKNPQSGEYMEIPMVVNAVTKMTVIKK